MSLWKLNTSVAIVHIAAAVCFFLSGLWYLGALWAILGAMWTYVAYVAFGERR